MKQCLDTVGLILEACIPLVHALPECSNANISYIGCNWWCGKPTYVNDIIIAKMSFFDFKVMQETTYMRTTSLSNTAVLRYLCDGVIRTTVKHQLNSLHSGGFIGVFMYGPTFLFQYSWAQQEKALI